MGIDRSSYRRRLPHYQSLDRTYFVTYVSVGRWILPNVARDIAYDHILFEHRRKVWLETFTVMPDHVHIIMKPLPDKSGYPIALPDILHGIKGVSGRMINKALVRKGPVWQHESFDHELRSDESIRETCEYVAMNPVRKGLVATPDEYPWLWRQWIDDKENEQPPA